MGNKPSARLEMDVDPSFEGHGDKFLRGLQHILQYVVVAQQELDPQYHNIQLYELLRVQYATLRLPSS